MRLFLTIFLLLYSLAATADTQQSVPYKINRYVANQTAWNVNAYWLESDSGIVLIDAQLLPSDAEKMGTLIKATGKPLLGAIITHPHLDHFGGLPTLQRILGDFPVYATSGTEEGMEGAHQELINAFRMPNLFGEALDPTFLKPTHLVSDGDILTIAGIKLIIHDVGPGETTDHILIQEESQNVVFAGDTFFPYTHYFVGQGFIDGVLSQLKYIKETFPSHTYVLGGHNDPSRVASTDAQIAYVEKLVSMVASARGDAANLNEDGRLTKEARSRVIAKMRRLYPGYDDFGLGVGMILAWNIAGVETYLVQKKQ